MGRSSTLKINPLSSPVKNWHLVVSLFNGDINFHRPEGVLLQRIFSWEMTGWVIFPFGLIYNVTPAYGVLPFSLYDTAGRAPRMNVLFWGLGDFPVSYLSKDTSWNAWNRHSGSFRVDTGLLFSNVRSPLSWMLNGILTIDQFQWFPNRSDFPPIFWLFYRAYHHRITSGFHGAFATGVASQQGTLTFSDTWFRPSPLWGLAYVSVVDTMFTELAVCFRDFSHWIPLGAFSILLWREVLVTHALWGHVAKGQNHTLYAVSQVSQNLNFEYLNQFPYSSLGYMLYSDNPLIVKIISECFRIREQSTKSQPQKLSIFTSRQHTFWPNVFNWSMHLSIIATTRWCRCHWYVALILCSKRHF